MTWKSMALLCICWMAAESLSSHFIAAVSIADDDNQERLNSDLRALGHPEFRMREAASLRLFDVGVDAVIPLAQLAQTGNAEASIRAFELLRQLYTEGNEEIAEAVESAYEAILHGENVLAAVRVEMALETASAIRHRRALTSFRKLGGILRFSVAEELFAEGSSPPIKYAMITREWKGGDEGLKFLRRIEDFRSPKLTTLRPALYVIKGSISPAALVQLKVDLPDCVADRGPACLGVQPELPSGDPMEIALVLPGSAADKAGLQKRDIILNFDDAKIPNFTALVKQIGERQPGDKVRVLYLRDGEEKTTIVELGEWEK